jgi:hypothetical protein
MKPITLLILNLAMGFYNTGTIWAHEVDIFRSWRLVGAERFHAIQRVHWRKLPYWIFIPFGLALAGAIALIWYHPSGSPVWGIWGALTCQLLALVLTIAFWGRWQAMLSRDQRGPESPYLRAILRTHWVRTALITASGLFLCAWVMQVVASP